ncbi:hypothetical protein SDC9_12676 [bioreactor metagenome]|jgi:Uncharacterized conserved protein|uniref:Phosphatidylglycerol lysyltransferase C-terminal domain-containing protein n=1 Tax=bioreactor metagenome TaxID=1076179 RepID=A0A644TKV2_9ZZZZ|nr:phosphatidylglycerol lysyltransferase domain-containing protein [Acidaminococcaceae bacterium]
MKKTRERNLILEFKHITLDDKPIFDDYFSEKKYYGSECNFTTLFIWRKCYDVFWAISHGCLIIKVTVNDVTFVLPAFGGIDEDLPLVIDALKEYFQGQPFEIHGIYEETIERFKTFLPNITEYQEDRDNWDYVYLREKLATLSGRKYHGKKNHVNSFRKEHPDYVYEPITLANKDECITFSDKWCESRLAEDESLKCEFCAIKEALNNFEVLNIEGGLIRINGEVEAFTFGEKQNDELVIVHVEKANPNIRGLYTVINQEFIQKNWIDVKYVNREEDMGKEGLRKAKESYNPEFMVKKYNTIIK